MGLHLQPITLAEAKRFVDLHHRHHSAPPGHKFSIGVNDGEQVVGCVIVGRPVARHFDDGYTAEVSRCCVLEGVPNGCSKLYAAAWRAARAMGYTRLITYTLASESGTSLRAAGWRELYQTKERAKGWNTPSRPRVPRNTQAKTLWDVEEDTQQRSK